MREATAVRLMLHDIADRAYDQYMEHEPMNLTMDTVDLFLEKVIGLPPLGIDSFGKSIFKISKEEIRAIWEKRDREEDML